MKMTLRAHVEMLDRATCKAFDHVGEMQGLFYTISRDGSEHVIPKIPELPKDIFMMLVRDALVTIDATRVIMIDEAWLLSGSRDDLGDERGSIEHAPGRIEIIMYAAEDETEGSIVARREILRDEAGTPSLGPLEFTAHTSAEGRMVGLLPNRGSTH